VYFSVIITAVILRFSCIRVRLLRTLNKRGDESH